MKKSEVISSHTVGSLCCTYSTRAGTLYCTVLYCTVLYSVPVGPP
jgi:hypothetical protein